MSSEPTICCIITQPMPGKEVEYHEWYDRQHLHDVVRVPGVISAQRFNIVEGAAEPDPHRRHLAIYEIDGDPKAFVEVLTARFGTDQMPASDALDPANISMTFWTPRGERVTV